MGADKGIDDNPNQSKVVLSKQDELDKEKFQKELNDRKDKLAGGPIMDRSCTDIICCLLFVAFMAGFVAASGYGWMNGDPNKLVVGWDSDGRMCGSPINGTEEYPYLYWPNAPTADIFDQLAEGNVDEVVSAVASLLNQGTCVKECPKSDSSIPVECVVTDKMRDSEDKEFEMADGTIGCTYQINAAFITDLLNIDLSEYEEVTGVDTSGATFPFRYDTAVYGGFCLPEVGDALEALKDASLKVVDTFYDDLVGDSGKQAMGDILISWPVLATACGTSLVLGYLFLFLITWIGGVIIYLFLAITVLSSLVGGYFVLEYSKSRPEGDSYNTWLEYGAYALWGISALTLCCICCCWGAIKVAVAVYKTTAQYVRANMRIFILPFFSWVFQVLWVGVWVVCAIYVFSVGEPAQRAAPWEFTTEIMWSDTTRYILWYQIFGLFWIAAFINGLCQFIIAASSCIWYFTVNTDTKGEGTVGTAFYWGFRYHMGSVAFGSFCIAVVQTIRLLFEWYRRMIAKASKDNKCVKALLCMTSYCLWLLEKCVKFISKNAYIQVALTNDFFCKAAWNAFALILANAARFGWATSVGAILNFFGLMCIAATNSLAAYIYLTEWDTIQVQSPIWPVVLVGLISLLIGNTFLSIFGFSSDAILQSFLLDESLKFANVSRPEYMQDLADSLNQKGCC